MTPEKRKLKIEMLEREENEFEAKIESESYLIRRLQEILVGIRKELREYELLGEDVGKNGAA